MFKLVLQIALRNLWKQKGFSAINLFGMTVGMSCCFLILIFLQHERSYDRFHANGDRLYRVNYQAKFSGSTFELTRIPAPIGPMLADHFPEIQVAARLFPRSISMRDPESDRMFEIERGMFADSTTTQVFQFEWLHGNPESALLRPFSIVLTDETARRVLGTTEAMGKHVLLAGQTTPFTVSGVVKDFPDNAHLHFDFLAPFANIVDVEPAYARDAILNAQTNNWMASYTHTYVLLRPGASSAGVNAALPAFLRRYGNPDFVEKQGFVLYPVRDIHLHSASQDEPVPVANATYMRIFGIVGFLILLIACINFVNLSNAIYLGRMKEVGVRKVLGAGRRGLIGQFAGETMLICALAFGLSLLCVQALLPLLDQLTNRHLSYGFLRDWPLTAAFTGIFLLAGLLAGVYPAFFASRIHPAAIFQQHGGHTGGKHWLRKTLITVQFVVGIALLSGTLIVASQLRYWKSQPLGFNQNLVLSVPLFSPSINAAFTPGDQAMRQRMNSFEDRLMQNPNIEGVTLASSLPGITTVRHPITTDKIALNDNVILPCLSVDYNFAQTFGLQIVAGRDFGKAYGTDHIDGFIINEKAVKTLGWDSPQAAIGQAVGRGAKKGKVVGVVRDFHTQSLQSELEPLVMDISVGSFTTFGIRVKNANVPETIDFIAKNWRACFPEKAFDYTFLDERLQNAYEDESRLAQLIGYFAAIAIFLSCFGLFGLISFTVQQKAKEIGIRKVLGASVAGLVGLLAKDYLKLVMLALALATPLAWYLMKGWLADFAYHIEIGWWVFLLAGAAAMGIAFATVAVQSMRAALANPVDSLRNE